MNESFSNYLKGILTILLITLAVYVYDGHHHPTNQSSLLEIFGALMLVMVVIVGFKEYNK
jgi:hypothetical protein